MWDPLQKVLNGLADWRNMLSWAKVPMFYHEVNLLFLFF